MAQQPKKNDFMTQLATFIVDKRNLFFLIIIIAIVFSMFSRNWVNVENDLISYLPDDAETKIALNLMEEQFTTYGTAEVMVANVSYDEADELHDMLSDIKGVQSVAFDETTDHYNHASALFTMTFDYDENDDECLDALDAVKAALDGYDLYVSTDLGNTLQDTIASEVSIIMVYVAVIVVAVLLFTSQTYGEVPVLLLTFVTAMILNQGSSFLLGTISFVSNSVTSILQLALSLDYAVILCNHFKEQHETMPIREAAISALAKSIPEISASSLTTVGGLAAMMFMQFKIGPDMGINLIKAIMFALLSVFVLMPGLLVLFGPLIDKTKHKNFVPKIPFVGKIDYATRHVVPIVFVVIALLGLHFSNNCPYAYGYSSLTTPKLNESQIADNMIADNFTSQNMLALVVPAGDYDKEKALLEELETYDEIDYTMGLANVEAMDGYMLADKLTPRQFSELAGLDYEAAQLIYAAYAAENGDYGKLMGSIASYKVPLIDMFLFVCQQVDDGIVTLDEDQTDMLADAKTQMESAKAQLSGTEYSRMLLYLTLPESGDETYSFIDTIRSIAQGYYPDGSVYVAGNSTNEYDFKKSFARDNAVVSIVSILIVLVVLLFTFKSAGMPVLLILVIQGSIWINFSIPTLTGTGLFFMSYLVVSSIQMGANIDYAIVISSHYTDLKKVMHHKEAIVAALNESFPTIFTSGSILASAGVLISVLTTNPVIAAIGECLGRGTIVSILLVLFVLPQILVLGDVIIERTSFEMKGIAGATRNVSGTMHINGRVRGYINGVVDADIKGVLHGQFNAAISTGTEVDVTQPDMYLTEGSVTEAESAETNDTTEGGGEQ